MPIEILGITPDAGAGEFIVKTAWPTIDRA